MAKVEKKVCLKCTSEKRLGEFYKSNSELNSDGKLPWCKDCVQDRYNTLLTIYNGRSLDSFKHLLFNLDEFFSEELYNECVMKDGTKFIGEYFKVVNRDKNYRENTSLNNTLESNESKDIQLEDGNIVDERLIVEWGRARNKEDYMILEKRYKELANRFPSKSPEEQYIIKDICKLELDIEECRRLGKTDKIASLENIKSKKMKDLDIIPSEKKNSMSDKDIKIFGMGMKIYETTRPIPQIADAFNDVDNMNSYWDRTIVKPMAKMQGLANGEYSLENGMDDIELSPDYMKTLNDMYGDEDE